jgi:CRISPR-associated protein Cas2
MARRRFLVAYDIRDDQRLRSVATCAEAYGYRIQYSVFICDLSDQEAIVMRGEIEALVKATEDSVMIIDLGHPTDTTRFIFVGPHPRLPTTDAVIV